MRARSPLVARGEWVPEPFACDGDDMALGWRCAKRIDVLSDPLCVIENLIEPCPGAASQLRVAAGRIVLPGVTPTRDRTVQNDDTAGSTPANPTIRCDIDGRPLDLASRRWRAEITYHGKATPADDHPNDNASRPRDPPRRVGQRAPVSASVSPATACSHLICLTCVGVSASGYVGGGR